MFQDVKFLHGTTNASNFFLSRLENVQQNRQLTIHTRFSSKTHQSQTFDLKG